MSGSIIILGLLQCELALTSHGNWTNKISVTAEEQWNVQDDEREIDTCCDPMALLVEAQRQNNQHRKPQADPGPFRIK